jgi:hypothetical protein
MAESGREYRDWPGGYSSIGEQQSWSEGEAQATSGLPLVVSDGGAGPPVCTIDGPYYEHQSAVELSNRARKCCVLEPP